MASADYIFSIEVTKYSSRNVYGIQRIKPDSDDLLYLLMKHMILFTLGNDVCKSELTDEEEQNLTSVIVLKS